MKDTPIPPAQKAIQIKKEYDSRASMPVTNKEIGVFKRRVRAAAKQISKNDHLGVMVIDILAMRLDMDNIEFKSAPMDSSGHKIHPKWLIK